MFVKKYPALLLLKCRVNRVNGWIANHVFSSSNLRDTFVEISKWILLNSIDFVLQVFNFRKIIRYWALKVTVCIQQWKLKCQENMNFDASGAFCELIGIIVMGPSVMKSKIKCCQDSRLLDLIWRKFISIWCWLFHYKSSISSNKLKSWQRYMSKPIKSWIFIEFLKDSSNEVENNLCIFFLRTLEN